MTQVDFYTLAQQTREERWLFACRLVEKSINKGHEVLVLLESEEQAKMLDKRLWNYRRHAFIPHCLLSQKEQNPHCSVHLGIADDIGHHHDVLICLTKRLPSTFSRFKRLLEVVIQDDEVLNYTRKHYTFLKNRGFPIEHHDMRT